MKFGYPLQMAIEMKNYRCALLMLKCKDIDIHKSKRQDGNNLMHLLFSKGVDNKQARKISKKLIEMKIDVNKKNKNDMTPLAVAIVNNQPSSVEFALKYYPHLFNLEIGCCNCN